MSSLPPREHDRANIQQATHKVNRFAKRDPALYPLSFIVVGAFAAAGYFFMTKSAEPDAQRSLVRGGMVNPWESTDKQDTHPSAVAAFKYRHKTREGHYEDSLPALNEDVRNLKDQVQHKFHTN
ncbi:hypothetical protein EHS25_003853 [Saitozyma podzolica]|uniref:Uncharacterized protein n=1 Tax=Saitozyma podzolica TaxID=1890683 RepID=A0A427Y3R0_9TREE|nr:hypothetical protein EHS25_003853 [Saitozyma podzolica]